MSRFRTVWRFRHAYLFISPFFVGFLLFGLFPILFSFYLSFQKWSGFDEMQFVGLDNYRAVLSDTRFVQSMGNMVYLWLGHIFIMLALALLLAVSLNLVKLRGRALYRAIFYLPHVSATAAMALVFGLILDTDSGVLNLGLDAVGLPQIPWLSDPAWSKPSLILLNIWNVVGWYMLIFLAGLQSIEPALYEAAEVDGANAWQKLRFITFPLLRGFILFAFIVETIGSFQIFTEPYVLTGGGPLDSTLTPVLYLYESAFEFHKLGYASAIAFVLFAAVAVASIALARFWRERTA